MKLLFVCVQNAGRSQMAQAFAELAGIEARSAGNNPATAVHPEVIEAMQEKGIDLSGHTPKKLDEAAAQWADVVVTMGCGDACPYIPGKRYIDWELPDPHGMGVAGVRSVRDSIEQLVTDFKRELPSN